ncbi:hypothetical protein OVA03_08965 [Asticcacaulis sp. SL142]|uniref:hypothetical protein n=1 Tax=Asticcacaulis sp. SL142 TaxID=2995155 RepID=UPI00226CDBC4|nr:hypothetical protein [Asticcacaulis sp. SL142]WAC46849.1 hypothetical protein OVA03_08965 [Asticcacaulis sp. SL142]
MAQQNVFIRLISQSARYYFPDVENRTAPAVDDMDSERALEPIVQWAVSFERPAKARAQCIDTAGIGAPLNPTAKQGWGA